MNVRLRVEVENKKNDFPSTVPCYESLVSLKENTDRKTKKYKKERKKKIRLEHKPNCTVPKLCIMLKINPIINNSR